jgi:hypothetical protein
MSEYFNSYNLNCSKFISGTKLDLLTQFVVQNGMEGTWLVRFGFGNSLAAGLELILWAEGIEEDVALVLAQEC